MLKRRSIINDWESEYNKHKKSLDDDKDMFEINKVKVFFVKKELTTISKDTPLDKFLLGDINIKKIAIIKDFQKRVTQQIKEYKNAEIFRETEMMEDIPSKVFIPEHRIITEDERKELLSKISENEMPKMFVTNMMARYFNAKVGDIFKITRPSSISGFSIIYRVVINGGTY